jgi:hypothetical protein
MFHETWNKMESIYLFFKWANTWRLSFPNNFIAPIEDGILGGEGNPIGTLYPPGSIIVVMKTFSTLPTSLLKWASFHQITFQLNFFKSFKKNTCVTWLGKMKSSKSIGNLCQKLTTLGTQHHLAHTLGYLINYLIVSSTHIWKWHQEFERYHNLISKCLLVPLHIGQTFF